VQSAVDAAHEINLRGILMQDCKPRNVVVDQSSQAPFIIDFADCTFRDEMMQGWDEYREQWISQWPEDADEADEALDPDPEIQFWKNVCCVNNPADIGLVMTTILRNQKGMTLDVKLHDHQKIINDMRAARQREPQKCEGVNDKSNGNDANDAVVALEEAACLLEIKDDVTSLPEPVSLGGAVKPIQRTDHQPAAS
jgi:hypothetical protein